MMPTLSTTTKNTLPFAVDLERRNLGKQLNRIKLPQPITYAYKHVSSEPDGFEGGGADRYELKQITAISTTSSLLKTPHSNLQSDVAQHQPSPLNPH